MSKFAEVGRIFSPKLKDVSDWVAAEGCCEEIKKLMKEIGMWLKFKDFGVDRKMLRKIADRGQDLPDYKNNPVIADVNEIYKELMEGYERV